MNFTLFHDIYHILAVLRSSSTVNSLSQRSVNNHLSDTQLNRVIATRDRFKQTAAFRNGVPGTDLTTASLKGHEQSLNPIGGESMASVCWSVSNDKILLHIFT